MNKEYQGKKQKQIRDSEYISSVGLIVLTILFIILLILKK